MTSSTLRNKKLKIMITLVFGRLFDRSIAAQTPNIKFDKLAPVKFGNFQQAVM